MYWYFIPFCYHFLVWINHISFISSSVNQHLSCFHLMAIMSNIAMNMYEQVFPQTCVFISLGYIHRSRNAGSCDNPKVSFFSNLFIYFWLGPHSSVRASSSHRARASHHGGFSCCRAQALGHEGSVVAVPGFSCPAAYGILPDQGSHSCPLHWQEDSEPLDHQKSPMLS